MDTTEKDGGPAFPRTSSDYASGYKGMSCLDWFAGQAMAGMLAGGKVSSNAMPQLSFALAERMLEEARKRKESQ